MATSSSFLYLNHNISLPFPTESDHSFLYANHNITNDQPRPSISLTDPADILIPGESCEIFGFNFEGRNDGGDMQPEVRFYAIPNDLGAWHEVLTVVAWDINDDPGIFDGVEVLLPLDLPSSGYLVIVHTGISANPYNPASNYYAVAVESNLPVLDLIDFDNTNINMPTSAAANTYWIGAASLSGKLYISSKRTAPFSIDGDKTVAVLGVSDFVDPAGENEVSELWNAATGGTFTITVGSYGTTAAIAHHAAAATVKAALDALTNVTVTVTGSGTSASPWRITFTEPAGTDMPTLTTDDSLLTPASVTTVQTITVGGTPVDPDSSFPKAFFLARAHSRMWAANVRYGDNTEHRSRLHYSAPLKPEVWYAEDYVDFDPDDGQQITGMINYGEGLLVFKENTVQLLTGASEASFARQSLIEGTGTQSPYSVAQVGGIVYFLDPDSGVWAFDGGNFVAVSDKIRAYLLAGMNYSAIYTAAAFSYRNKYILSVPWGTASYPTRTFVYDTTLKAWWEYDYGVRNVVEARNRMYAVGPKNAAGVYRLDIGSLDGADEIDAFFETPWIAPGGHSNKHRTRRLDMAFSNLGGAVKIDQYNDFDPTTIKATATKTVSDPLKDQVLNLVGGFSGSRWETMQLKVANVDGSDFQLNRVVILWNALSRVRGVDG